MDLGSLSAQFSAYFTPWPIGPGRRRQTIADGSNRLPKLNTRGRFPSSAPPLSCETLDGADPDDAEAEAVCQFVWGTPLPAAPADA